MIDAGAPPGDGMLIVAGQLRLRRAATGPGVTGEPPHDNQTNDVSTTATDTVQRRNGSMIGSKATQVNCHFSQQTLARQQMRRPS